MFPSKAPVEALPVLAGVSKPSNEKKCGATVLKEHFHDPPATGHVLKCVIQPQLNLTWRLLYCWPMSLAQRLCNCVLGDTDFIYGRKGH